MTRVPTSTADIDAEWLTEVLRRNAGLQSSVTSVRLQPIGEGVGLMGELGRLHLEYEGDEDLPATMVAKCAAQSENRQVAQILDFYTREADFYNRVSTDCPLAVPQGYYADVNPDTYDFVLLMQDLGDVSPRDQLIGASEEEVFSAVGKIAELHARWWGVTADDHDWMYDMMSEAEAVRLRDILYKPALGPTLENFGDLLNEEHVRILQTVGDQFVEHFARNITPTDSFVHGDYRQDNMLYQDGNPEALVMDWQISGRGKPIFDVAYFMCQSVTSDLRARIERQVLEHYLARLSELGVSYAFEDAWGDYRRMILGCLVYPVTVCGTLDTANERGKALGETMLSRNLSAIEDLGCVELIGGLA